MGKIVLNDQPCLDSACGSSNAVQVFEDKTGWCFSCQKSHMDYAIQRENLEASGWTPGTSKSTPRRPGRSFVAACPDNDAPKKEWKKDTLDDIKAYHSRSFKDRNISKEACEFFGVRASNNIDGQIDTHYYPYEGESNFKIRKVADKKFFWAEPGNPSKDLFGRDKFNSGGKRVVIVEGELDVLSVADAFRMQYNGTIYPVVGMSSGVMTESLLANRDWLRSFDEVVLFMDQDKVGQAALEKALKIVGVDKAKIVKTAQFKDANEVLMAEEAGPKALMRLIFDAAYHIPSGMITKAEIRKRMLERQNRVAIPYPPCLQGFNTKLTGMRGGEISLFISGTGAGKTTMMKEIQLHLLNFQPQLDALIAAKNEQLEEEQEPLKPQKIKIGGVSLEEPPEESAEKLAAMYLRRNMEEEHVPMSAILGAFDEFFDEEKIMLLDHQGSMGDGTVIDKLEYMILSGCTHLFVDHITILVSEGTEGLTGNEAIDKIMNDLLGLVTRYPHVWIGLVSHLRKTSTGKPFEQGEMPTIDDIKGSGSIKQVSFDIVAFCRDMTAITEELQNHIMACILKCRRTGKTGDVPGALYHRPSGRLQYAGDNNYGPRVREGDGNKESFRRVETVVVPYEDALVAHGRQQVPPPSVTTKSSPPALSLKPTLKVPAVPSPTAKGF
jgi:twinkle protein